jgi:hypothetical protein
MPPGKREKIDFQKGDKLFSPTQGFVTIIGTRGFGSKKEFCIEIAGEKVWYPKEKLIG